MKIAVITAAGISSRFNKGLPEKEKCLKAVYRDGNIGDTLLLRLLRHCSFANKIIVVGGYQFDALKEYVENEAVDGLKRKITLIYNSHYKDLASGYSLYVGLERAFKECGLEEVLYVEGDLDIDAPSFKGVCEADSTVLTYNHEPIYADKAVVLYQDSEGRYHYAFNASHGLLSVKMPFSCILNSGQLWKFTDIDALKEACRAFYDTCWDGSNLEIIQRYIDRIPQESIRLFGLRRWTNCNTREDFYRIKMYWRNEYKHERIKGKTGNC